MILLSYYRRYTINLMNILILSDIDMILPDTIRIYTDSNTPPQVGAYKLYAPSLSHM